MTDTIQVDRTADEHAASARTPRAFAGFCGRLAKAIVVPVGLLLFWELAVDLGWMSGRLMPPPSRVLQTLWVLLQSGELLTHVWITTLRVLFGFVLGTIAGTIAGALTGYFPLARQMLDPMLQALRAIPSIAWVPLFILWLGIFETSKIALIAVGVFFPVYLGFSGALQSVDRKIVEVGRIFRLSGFALVRRILLPAVFPAYVLSLRAGLGLGWMFVVAAEFMGASEGLGYLLVDGQQLGKPAQIMAAILCFAIIGKATDSLLVFATTPLLRWQDNFRRGGWLMLSLRGLSKTFAGDVHALEGFSLDVKPGEIVAVIGGSGCGKSTLLRLVSGLDQPSRGRVLLGDEAVVAPHPLINLIFQEPRLLPWLTVAGNIGFGLADHKAVERAGLVHEALERVGLSSFGTRWPKELSGGQAQRVAIARALVTRPEVLLLDEPFSALDAFTRIDLQDHLLDIWDDMRPTLILVTHDIEEAIVLADRVIVMRPRPGRILEEVVIALPRKRDRTSAAFDVYKRDILALLNQSLRSSPKAAPAGF